MSIVNNRIFPVFRIHIYIKDMSVLFSNLFSNSKNFTVSKHLPLSFCKFLLSNAIFQLNYVKNKLEQVSSGNGGFYGIRL